MDISIPHGTIKRPYGRRQGFLLLQFQYLMVQLKVCIIPLAIYLLVLISIPHGTIKSLITPIGEPNSQIISIPHGTIKRHFHILFFFDSDISIPHGTIKSMSAMEILSNITLFQYLMVQLKDFLELQVLLLARYFNTSWYN